MAAFDDTAFEDNLHDPIIVGSVPNEEGVLPSVAMPGSLGGVCGLAIRPLTEPFAE